MDCGRILACLQNESQASVVDAYNETVFIPPIIDEPLIDSETYTINKVCFTLALLFAIAHVTLMIYFRRLCRLYGVCIVLELICFMFLQLLTLISCSLQHGTQWGMVIGKMADFTIMATIAANLMSSVHVCRQLWLGVTLTPLGSVKIVTDNVHFRFGRITIHWSCRPFYIMICVITILIIPGGVLLVGTRIPQQSILSEEHMEFANISCHVVPDFEHLYLFFPAIATLLTGQLVCLAIAAKMRYSERHDSFLLAHLPHLNARLWITIKLAVTYCLIWTMAFVAIFYASVALWHVFTLLCSLQSIYVTVNCVFSRPVLDLIHQWHEDKMEELKAEQAIICQPLKRAVVVQPRMHHAQGRYAQANNVSATPKHSTIVSNI